MVTIQQPTNRLILHSIFLLHPHAAQNQVHAQKCIDGLHSALPECKGDAKCSYGLEKTVRKVRETFSNTQMSILAWEADSDAGTVNPVNYLYTLLLLFKLLPQQQADTTDTDIMLCYAGPQTTIFVILLYLIPYSFVELGVLIKAVSRQLIHLKASEECFLHTQCLTHCVSH